ncbi:hypothetical protein SLE2022_094840 [Rubroshorea leprosula]
MQPHLKKEQQMMLWNLHRIVVDVVRSDSHLEVYKDTRNLARMSDILAVYAWVDPATGYCQVMIDLLSPFVILFEDNAEAFWCFEMFIRRLRENFQMEGPSRVMRQLQALWHILKHTDREIFRRELSFNEALCMWEMIWAANFDESLAHNLEENSLGALIIELPMDSGSERKEEGTEYGNGSLKGTLQSNQGTEERSIPDKISIHLSLLWRDKEFLVQK